MTTKLDKSLRRELDIDGQPYTVVISPDGVKITPKGARTGQEMTWRTLLRADASFAGKPEGLAE